MAGDQDGWIEVKGARTHNLKDISVALPKGKFVVISGVSGSGKSSLVRGVILPKVKNAISENKTKVTLQSYAVIKGIPSFITDLFILESPLYSLSNLREKF